MEKIKFCILKIAAMICSLAVIHPVSVYGQDTSQAAIVPSFQEINRAFGFHDMEAFKTPPKVYYPETWFHYIGGNVSLEGITKDLEAIADTGISGIQLFHGQFGGPWPGVDPQITSLSPLWDNAVRHTAAECRRLGLRFTMQNCPGWAMSGGPWIESSNAMRHLVWSRTDVEGGARLQGKALAVSESNDEDWRDYQDIAVLAFPTPEGDTGQPLKPGSIKSNHQLPWEDCLQGNLKEPFRFTPVSDDNPHWIEVTFEEPVFLRTVEFPSINGMSHGWCYEPGVTVKIEAVLGNGKTQDILITDMPQASWQDDQPISFACSELTGVSTYRISFVNKHDMALPSLRLFSAARQNNWESEAGWTLRSIERNGENPNQSPTAYVDPEKVIDISDKMDANGQLNWNVPKGKWTVLRIGHVNTGARNAPAPPEGTGWECNKLSVTGADAQFAGYIGRLANGPLEGGLLNGMLMDSWECKTQTWTPGMEDEFYQRTDYSLRKWLPAVFGYVVEDPETTKRFLRDWRSVIGDMFANNFYGRMAEHAKRNGMSITYETAAGDIFPADIMEYFKHADVPMCEFWQPFSENFVGSLNFKPIKPTASAARIYGKPRVAAEAFTSFSLTWDEHLEMLKESANMNSIEGVTHLVFHTYTHNPQTPFLPPGTSFGSNIGTPFLRGQTWWKFMPEFTAYLSRCSYLLERGKPVSDVLWYLGDEINHKPDQNYVFPEGIKYDYCNPDVLLNRLTVRDGNIVTPEGLSYRLLWMPDAKRMLPETLEKLYTLINEGAIVVGDAPEGIVTLIGGNASQRRFYTAVNNIWGDTNSAGMKRIGKGAVISGKTINEALEMLQIVPDVKGGNALWVHRQIDGADWYFVCPPHGEAFKGTLDFRANGNVEIWDPVTGSISGYPSKRDGDYTSVTLDLPNAGSCFVVFRRDDSTTPVNMVPVQKQSILSIDINERWSLSFPSGWGAPIRLRDTDLKPWKDLDITDEGKAYSGTAHYSTVFDAGKISEGCTYILDLGEVDMVAEIVLNGEYIGNLWARPYSLDITKFIKSGINKLNIAVTSTWFNRLVYDAGQPEDKRKTWTINGPSKDAELRPSGLMGPVTLQVLK